MNELEGMIRAIEADIEYSRHEIGKAVIGPRVIEAIRSVPRDEFIARDHKNHVYDNRPLPIGHGQTISQPYIVALMIDLLQSKETDVVLDIGTGSGYQAAILSRLVKQVYGIEIADKLACRASARLRRLEHCNVEIRASDDYYGWPEHAPFEGIIVAAASTTPDKTTQTGRTAGNPRCPVPHVPDAGHTGERKRQHQPDP